MKNKIKSRIKELKKENQVLTNGFLIMTNNAIIHELQKLIVTTK